MKPTDEACKEFRRVYNNTHVSPEAQVRASLTAAFAAQFKPVETHAELVNQLRSIDEERLNNKPYSCEQLCKKAADAIEALLAERDALRKWKEDDNDAMRIFARYRELEAERDALLARLAPVDDEALLKATAQAICDYVYVSPDDKIEFQGIARAALAAIRPHIEADIADKFISTLRRK